MGLTVPVGLVHPYEVGAQATGAKLCPAVHPEAGLPGVVPDEAVDVGLDLCFPVCVVHLQQPAWQNLRLNSISKENLRRWLIH